MSTWLLHFVYLAGVICSLGYRIMSTGALYYAYRSTALCLPEHCIMSTGLLYYAYFSIKKALKHDVFRAYMYVLFGFVILISVSIVPEFH